MSSAVSFAPLPRGFGAAERRLLDESGHRQASALLDTGLLPHLRKRTLDQLAHPTEVTGQEVAASPARISSGGLQNLERECGRVEPVPQLVGEKAELLCAFVEDGSFTLTPKFGYGRGNGIIQASVQNLELAAADRDLVFDGDFRNRLAKTPVVMDDLTDGEPDMQEVAAVHTAPSMSAVSDPRRRQPADS
jgi:hypothetical protein